jgi:AraC-like DNA-binding protein
VKIQATFVASLLEYAANKGVQERQLLRQCLATPNLDVCNPTNYVSGAEYIKVFKTLMMLTEDRKLGMHFGCYLNIKAVGFIVQLSLNATSIEQAVFILKNYFDTLFPLVQLATKEDNERYILTLGSTIKDEKVRTQILDFVFCFMYRELKLMLPAQLKNELLLSTPKPWDLEELLHENVSEGDSYSFSLLKKVLSVEINPKSLQQIELLLPKYLQLLNQKKASYKAFSLEVRLMILNLCSPQLPSFEDVAVQFALSHRTIQRKLTKEGQSFRSITNDITKELSSYLNKDGKMKTKDIAQILGYSESSAYLHAVKKWNNND